MTCPLLTVALQLSSSPAKSSCINIIKHNCFCYSHLMRITEHGYNLNRKCICALLMSQKPADTEEMRCLCLNKHACLQMIMVLTAKIESYRLCAQVSLHCFIQIQIDRKHQSGCLWRVLQQPASLTHSLLFTLLPRLQETRRVEC